MAKTLPTILVTLLAGLTMAAEAEALVFAKVQVEVWEIRATRSNKDISRELQPIAAQLKRQFKYTGFKLVKVSRGSADIKETHVARLASGYSARITPLALSGDRIQLAVEVKRLLKKRVNAKITINKGGMQLFGGWDYPGSKDDVMIVGVRAR